MFMNFPEDDLVLVASSANVTFFYGGILLVEDGSGSSDLGGGADGVISFYG